MTTQATGSNQKAAKGEVTNYGKWLDVTKKPPVESDLNGFISWRIDRYEDEKWRNYELWEAFVEDFIDFTETLFQLAGKDYLRKLRSFLRANGVYVNRQAGIPMAKELFKVVQEEKQHQWTKEEVEDQINYEEEDQGDEDIPSDELDLHNDLETLILETDSSHDDPDINSDQSITTLGTIDGCDMLFENLANQSTYHILMKDINTHDNDDSFAYTTHEVENKYMQKELYGIMIDTVSNWLTRGYEQDMAYNKCSSVGTITINPPPTGRTMFNFHVVNADTSFLLCLRDIAIYLDSHPMHGKSPSRFLYNNMDFNHNKGLEFVSLDFASSDNELQIVVFTDSSFANNSDYSSQIGFVIVMTDDKKANVIHWSSVKCKRVTRSVLASELYAMAYVGAAIKATLQGIFQREIPLVLCTDSRSLYDCLVKLGTTHEKRLMIDLMHLRQSYERREIAEVKWIDGNSNPADAMTKQKPCNALKKLIDTNEINIDALQWVERTQ